MISAFPSESHKQNFIIEKFLITVYVKTCKNHRHQINGIKREQTILDEKRLRFLSRLNDSQTNSDNIRHAKIIITDCNVEFLLKLINKRKQLEEL